MDDIKNCLQSFLTENLESVDEIHQMLIHDYKYKPASVSNFMMANNYSICCFRGKTLYLTNEDLIPLLYYDSTSNISACGISRDGEYMACQLAYNQQDDDDSGATILFNVKTKKVVCRSKDVFLGNIRSIFIDTQKEIISIYYGDRCLGRDDNFVVKYDFSFQPDEKTVSKFYQKPDISPYALERRVEELAERATSGKVEITAISQEIDSHLKRMGESSITKFRLSSTYKKVGDMYASSGLLDKALLMYETGLELNPRLSVKKIIQRIRKEI